MGSSVKNNGPKDLVLLQAKLMGWDLEEIRKFLLDEAIIEPDKIDQIEIEYKRFMILTISYPDQIIPTSKEVDKMWHAHIIFTEDYFAFCDEVNDGKYIHHKRNVDELSKDLSAYYKENTLNLYQKLFGNVDQHFWAENAQICWGSGGGGQSDGET